MSDLGMNTLTFDQYARATEQTAIYRGAGSGSEVALMYVGLGVGGEGGEVCDVIKKAYRDGELDEAKLRKEIGDVIWYLARICREKGWSLGHIASENLVKLEDRKERGVLSGSGDDR